MVPSSIFDVRVVANGFNPVSALLVAGSIIDAVLNGNDQANVVWRLVRDADGFTIANANPSAAIGQWSHAANAWHVLAAQSAAFARIGAGCWCERQSNQEGREQTDDEICSTHQ